MKSIAQVFFLIALSMACYAQNNVINDQLEFNALKALWERTNGSAWTNNNGWPKAGSWPLSATAAQMDDWYGVTVTNGDINELILTNNHLVGEIPSQLGNLTSLINFYVNRNQLAGSLPSIFSGMNSLRYVFLDNNKFTGTLPPMRGQTIDVSNNMFTGDFPIVAGSYVVNILASNNGFTSLPPNITSLVPLNRVDFTNNELKTLPVAFAQRSDRAVIQLLISNNRIDLPALESFKGFSSKSVLIPQRSKSAISIALDNWCFQYKYDGRKRMTHKKIPGADWVYMVYDDRDRLVMTQDGEQRKNNRWTVTKYDDLNRPVTTAVYTHDQFIDQQAMTKLASKTPSVFPTTNLDVVAINYYDDYSFVPTNSDLTYQADQMVASFRVTGQATGTKVKVLGAPTPYYLTSVNYYDARGRVVQTVSENLDAGIDRVTNSYDFTGKLVRTSTVLGKNSTLRLFDYDHAGRLISTRHCINNSDTVFVSKNEYNEIGQVVTKKLHGSKNRKFFQDVGYTYNIRGWLTSMDGLFKMSLFYNDVNQGIMNRPLYNGNISAMQWNNLAYKLEYDPMSRLKNAELRVYNNSKWQSSNAFKESGVTYDLNGNIETLTRTDESGTLMDVLSYDYGLKQLRTNTLKRVTDSGTQAGFVDAGTSGDDYSYDKNGNLVTDKNKGIMSISYNMLNLPGTIVKNTGESVSYLYDATGRKLRQIVKNEAGVQFKQTDYRGDFIYENDTLKFANHEEGRVIMTSSKPEYQYHLKDHLGNVRTTFTTKKETERSTADFESQSADFLYYGDAVKINSQIFDHTRKGPTYYSSRLNGSSSERFGVAKSISVMPGDTVNMRVFAKYLNPDSLSWTTALASFLLSTKNVTMPIKDGIVAGGTTSSLFPFLSLLKSKPENDNDAPKAYLNWLLFDTNYVLKDGGAIQISKAAEEHGENTIHEKLSKQLLIKDAGFVYVYLSNDTYTMTGKRTEVYFDDFSVEHIKSPIIQSQDYYPFGLTFNEVRREGAVRNQYKYNGIEHQDDIGIGWDLARFRIYEPSIARFLQVDPIIKEHESPYAWNTNNPISFADPTGADSLQRAQALLRAQQYLAANKENNCGDTYPTKGQTEAGQFREGPSGIVDCSGMVSNAMMAAGEPDPNNQGTGNGVMRIAQVSAKIGDKDDMDNVQEGNAVTINNTKGKDLDPKKDFGHIGIISKVDRDQDGKIANMEMIDSGGTSGSGKSGPRVTSLIKDGKPNSYWGGRITGFYKWDKVLEGSRTNANDMTR